MQNMSYMYVMHVHVMQHDILTEYTTLLYRTLAFLFYCSETERENKTNLQEI